MAVRFNSSASAYVIAEPLFRIGSLEDLEKSPIYTVSFNGKPAVVYHTDSFDYVVPIVKVDSFVTVEIKVQHAFHKVIIRPDNAKIQPEIRERSVSFMVKAPQKLVLEFDNDLKTPLFILFTREVEKPEKVDYLFEKRKIYNIGTLELKPGDVVYLEEGSVVCGRIHAYLANNIRILGNGILNGCVWHPKEENGGKILIQTIMCNDMEMRGITVVDGGAWQIMSGACRNVVIENINIMSRVCTGDGIDIAGCEHVILRDSFIRASDDCVCIKACNCVEEGFTIDPSPCRDVRDILVERCVLWNAEPGNALEIGYELRCREVCDITFRDIDIVHCQYEGIQSGGVLTIHNADRPYVHDIHYEDIRIEDAQEKFIDIKVLDSKYSLDRIRGKVEYIYFKNIKIVNGAFPVSIIRGFEMANEVSHPRNIFFENINVLGQEIHSPNELRMVVELANDLYFGDKVYCVKSDDH